VGTDFGENQYALVNSSTAGGPAFRLTPAAPCGGSCSLFFDQARHAGAAAGAPAVDTFVLQVGDGACTVSGYFSAGPRATGAAAWTTTVPSCDASEGLGGAYRCFQASDDGSLVALQAVGKDAGLPNATARAYAFDGQTGAIRCADIPWPSLGEPSAAAKPLPGAAAGPGLSAAELRTLQTRWHPVRPPPPPPPRQCHLTRRALQDRFAQRFGARLDPAERDDVLRRVTHVAAAINALRDERDGSRVD
jgi:hypothetical protein